MVELFLRDNKQRELILGPLGEPASRSLPRAWQGYQVMLVPAVLMYKTFASPEHLEHRSSAPLWSRQVSVSSARLAVSFDNGAHSQNLPGTLKNNAYVAAPPPP